MDQRLDQDRDEVLALVREARELAKEAADEAREMTKRIEVWREEVRDGS